jgi:hypothetical protein
MIFNLVPKKDKFLEKVYKGSMKELEEFFEMKWKVTKPNIFAIKDRKSFDTIRGKKSQNWVIGENKERDIFLIDKKNFEKESSHKYSPKRYKTLIKHELCHSFFYVFSGGKYYPLWLNEGVAIFNSGKLYKSRRIKKFSGVLASYQKYSQKLWDESGFFIELLIKKFGKQKLLNLIKSLKEINSEKEFNSLFKKVYKFDLNYKEINKLYKNDN